MSIKMPEPEISLYVQCANGMQIPVRSFSEVQMQTYAQAVRDEALARQATVAHKALDNAKALASTLHKEAQQLNAESNPDALASERQANAILTAEVESLREDAERLDWIENQAKESRSGISIDWRSAYSEESRILEPKGWRFMRHHFLGDRKPNIREAIDAAIRALKEQQS